MKIQKIIAVALLIALTALAVVSFVLLPDTVITQLSFGGGAATTMPKIAAVAVPYVVGAVLALICLFGSEPGRKNTYLIVSAVLVAVMAVMLVVNL